MYALFKKEINNINNESSFEKDDEREKELNKLINTFNFDHSSNPEININQNQNSIPPKAIFSDNFEGKYDKDMNEELRNLAKQTKEIDNINIDNNLKLNQSLRNKIINNKPITTNISSQSEKTNGNKMAGKIYISKK